MNTDNLILNTHEEIGQTKKKILKLPKAKDYNPLGCSFCCESCIMGEITYNHDDQKVEKKKSMATFKSQANLNRHYQTEKHKNSLEDNPIECKHCRVLFSKEGFELHKKRNQMAFSLHDKKSPYKCNNFIYNSSKFLDMSSLINYKNDKEEYDYNKKLYYKDLKKIKNKKKILPEKYKDEIITHEKKKVEKKLKESETDELEKLANIEAFYNLNNIKSNCLHKIHRLNLKSLTPKQIEAETQFLEWLIKRKELLNPMK